MLRADGDVKVSRSLSILSSIIELLKESSCTQIILRKDNAESRKRYELFKTSVQSIIHSRAFTERSCTHGIHKHVSDETKERTDEE